MGGTIVRNALLRRTVLSASAASLVLLVTACGGSDKADAKPSGPASSSASAPAAKGKTDAELTPLLVSQADLTDHVLKPISAEDAKGGEASTSDKPECLPLVKAQSTAAIGTASGIARIAVVAKGKEPAADASPEEKLKAAMDALKATATSVTLQSYEGKGAAEAFGQLKSASAPCAGGYTANQGGESGKISKVTPAAPVAGGDEALAYTVVGDADGEPFTTQLVVVRKGNTLATFSAISLGGAAEQPTAVVAAQLKKLG
ncbi:hypothetical protein [Streptomyces sp. NBC_01264]|uniref:hypothetical protein n=1 Tax=Streptomyces sp. NBC_01264 TaxID=2903804 RepID=UPI0022547317|nr:hypothetical protein [Streptomyces sp. NBC_01264]MCX4780473.1 hypothetical protein [Streptomyces sp. NBC_01264]